MSFLPQLRFALIGGLILLPGLPAVAQLAKDRANIFAPTGTPIPTGADVLSLQSSTSIGYHVLQLPSGNIAVWYPTDAKPQPFAYRFATNTVQTEVAADAPPAAGTYPLIIYSHGALGSGLSSVFAAETLAHAGFIVAAPDHTDEVTLCRILPKDNPDTEDVDKKYTDFKFIQKTRTVLMGGPDAVSHRQELSYRPNQIAETIKQVLADPNLAPHIDSQKIGLFGHSFGAWTTMACSGTLPVYTGPAITAAVALSPPVNPYVFSAAELAQIKIPIMFMFGEKEVAQGRGDDRGLFYDKIHAPRYLLEIGAADHFTFAGGSKPEFGNSVSSYLTDDPRRAAIARYTLAFFEAYLKNDPQAIKQLNVRDPALVGYMKDNTSF